MKQFQTVKELMGSCVKYFEQQSYLPLRIDRYKYLWKRKLISFMVQKSILYYNPSVGEEYIHSKIVGRIITSYERDIIRSINVLSDFSGKWENQHTSLQCKHLFAPYQNCCLGQRNENTYQN